MSEAASATAPTKPERSELSAEERYYLASQWQLMWRKFRRHKLAIIGGSILIVLYLTAIFDEKECMDYFGEKYKEYMKRSKMFIPFLI